MEHVACEIEVTARYTECTTTAESSIALKGVILQVSHTVVHVNCSSKIAGIVALEYGPYKCEAATGYHQSSSIRKCTGLSTMGVILEDAVQNIQVLC